MFLIKNLLHCGFSLLLLISYGCIHNDIYVNAIALGIRVLRYNHKKTNYALCSWSLIIPENIIRWKNAKLILLFRFEKLLSRLLVKVWILYSNVLLFWKCMWRWDLEKYCSSCWAVSGFLFITLLQWTLLEVQCTSKRSQMTKSQNHIEQVCRSKALNKRIIAMSNAHLFSFLLCLIFITKQPDQSRGLANSFMMLGVVLY